MGRSSLAGAAGAALLLVATGAGAAVAQDPDGRVFHTTAGPLTRDEIGNVLAHQHMFVEYGAHPPTAFADVDPEMVYEVIGPWLEEAKALGIGTFVDPTPLGVGRRPDIVKYAADRAGLPTMMVTGIYREPFMPDWVYEASVGEIADFFRTEFTEGVGDTGVPAGWIKVSQNGTGMTLTERKVLEAACIVARETGAAIGSHIALWGSSAGPTALAVMDALEGFGCPLDEQRFIWIHAGVEAGAAGSPTEVTDVVGVDSGMDYLMEALRRGAYLSLDSIGSPFWGGTYADYADSIERIRQFVDAGYADRILIGSDTGWFDPGQPAGFELQQVDGTWTMVGDYAGDYSMIPKEFVPAMREAGFSEELINKLMQDNPWNAYSR
jgi:phosphotriesterase-related protein